MTTHRAVTRWTVPLSTMAAPSLFHMVEGIDRTPPVAEAPALGQTSSCGEMVVCMASDWSTESDTLFVVLHFDDRDALVHDET